LSIVTIVGNSFVRTLYYCAKRHRLADNRFMPDYNVIRLVIPFDGNTAYIGFVLNELLPNYIITICIVLLLCVLIFKTFQKAYDFCRHRETRDSIFLIIDNIEVEMDDLTLPTEVVDRPGETWWDIFQYAMYILFEFGLIAFFTIMRKLSLYPWAIYAAQFVLLMLLCYMIIKHIQLIYDSRRSQRFNFIEGDIEWNKPSSFIKYGLSASFVGLLSTLLGIGGGMIMNPIMINLQMLPEVVVATSSITSFFSSVISASQFIISEGVFEWYYGVLILIGAVASCTSLIILRVLRKRIKVFITVILGITLVVSMVMLVIVNIIDIVNNGFN
jgi:uncharacterized membrane protein YfcA